MGEISKGRQPAEFLSTHPGHDTRITQLHEWMPEALALHQEYCTAPSGNAFEISKPCCEIIPGHIPRCRGIPNGSQFAAITSPFKVYEKDLIPFYGQRHREVPPHAEEEEKMSQASREDHGYRAIRLEVPHENSVVRPDTHDTVKTPVH
jgi:hypothetical protein